AADRREGAPPGALPTHGERLAAHAPARPRSLRKRGRNRAFRSPDVIGRLPPVSTSRLERHMSEQRAHHRAPTTTDSGIPVGGDDMSLTTGAEGPVLLQDAYLIAKLAHFVRERVPDRVYHVKGGGAFGHFEVTDDVTQWTKAAFLGEVGKRT